jgi:hypothetical protein
VTVHGQALKQLGVVAADAGHADSADNADHADNPGDADSADGAEHADNAAGQKLERWVAFRQGQDLLPIARLVTLTKTGSSYRMAQWSGAKVFTNGADKHVSLERWLPSDNAQPGYLPKDLLVV